MSRVERSPGPDQPEPRGDTVDVRVDRKLGPVEREQEHARTRLAPDARQPFEELDRLVSRCGRERLEVERPGLRRDRTQHGLDPSRLHARDATRPDRFFDLLYRPRLDGP